MLSLNQIIPTIRSTRHQTPTCHCACRALLPVLIIVRRVWLTLVPPNSLFKLRSIPSLAIAVRQLPVLPEIHIFCHASVTSHQFFFWKLATTTWKPADDHPSSSSGSMLVSVSSFLFQYSVLIGISKISTTSAFRTSGSTTSNTLYNLNDRWHFWVSLPATTIFMLNFRCSNFRIETKSRMTPRRYPVTDHRFDRVYYGWQ